MEKQGSTFGAAALGTLAGMATGAAAAYAMSGDAALLRRNLRKMERGAQRAVHRMEKYLR